MEAIKTENLTKHYGKARGIEQISLTVEEGEFFGFIGPNGAGKSTMLNATAGVWPVDEGKIFIGGVDVTRLPEH